MKRLVAVLGVVTVMACFGKEQAGEEVPASGRGASPEAQADSAQAVGDTIMARDTITLNY